MDETNRTNEMSRISPEDMAIAMETLKNPKPQADHRFPESSGSNKDPNCQWCKGVGWIISKDAEGYEFAADCQCVTNINNRRRIEASGLVDVMETQTFENFRTDEPWQAYMLKRAKEFVEDNGGNWFFAGGQVGSGKTFICTAICVELMRRGLPVKYMRWRDEAWKLRDAMFDHSDESDDYSSAIEKYKRIKVLYIDDFMKTSKDRQGNYKDPTPSEINIAFEILNYRYTRPELITIISSERLLADLLDVDEAMGSRVYQKARGMSVEIDFDESKNIRTRDT